MTMSSDPDPATLCRECRFPIGNDRYTARYSVDNGESKLVSVICERCGLLDRILDYRKTRRITGKLWLEAALARGVDESHPYVRYFESINRSMERVTATLKGAYEPRVWFGGLQSFVRSTTDRYHSTVFGTTLGETRIMSAVLAGRAMQTINCKGVEITVICDETSSSPRSGIQSLDATEEQAILLLTETTNAWVDGIINLDVDNEVRFA